MSISNGVVRRSSVQSPSREAGVRPMSWHNPQFASDFRARGSISGPPVSIPRAPSDRKYSVQLPMTILPSKLHQSLKENHDGAGGFLTLNELRMASLHRSVNSDDSGFVDVRSGRQVNASKPLHVGDADYEELDAFINRGLSDDDDDDDNQTVVEDNSSDITVSMSNPQKPETSFADVTALPTVPPPVPPKSSKLNTSKNGMFADPSITPPPALPPRRRSLSGVPTGLKNGEATIPRDKYAEQIRRAQKSLSRVSSTTTSSQQPVITKTHSRSSTLPPSSLSTSKSLDLLPPALPPRIFKEVSLNKGSSSNKPSHSNSFHHDSYLSARGYTRSGFRGRYGNGRPESTEGLSAVANGSLHQHSVSSPVSQRQSDPVPDSSGAEFRGSLTTSVSVPQGFADMLRKSATITPMGKEPVEQPPVVSVRNMASVFERSQSPQCNSPPISNNMRVSQSFLQTPKGHVNDISRRFERPVSPSGIRSSQESLSSPRPSSVRSLESPSSFKGLRDAFNEDLRLVSEDSVGSRSPIVELNSTGSIEEEPELPEVAALPPPLLETDIDDVEEDDVVSPSTTSSVSAPTPVSIFSQFTQPSVSPHEDLVTEIQRLMSPVKMRREKLTERVAALRESLNEDLKLLKEVTISLKGCFRSLVSEKCSEEELSNYDRFLSRMDSMMKLSCQLSRRRNRLERQLEKAEEDGEKEALLSQVEELKGREEEADRLRTSVDASYHSLEKSLRLELSQPELASWTRAVQEKLRLMQQEQEKHERLQLAEEQLEALLESS